MVSSTKNGPDTAPKLYLVTGGTGAGKTTYARELAEEIGGLRFSIDEWMTTLFWMDSPDPILFEWTMARINRCEVQIWETACQALARNISVILDLGFTKTAHRAKFQELANRQGYEVCLHWLDVPSQTRWQRVQSRNTDKGDTFTMDVPREMFAFMEGEWDPPDNAEGESFSRLKILK